MDQRVLLYGSTARPRPMPVRRAPLGPFDVDTFESPDPLRVPPSWHRVSTTLPAEPPPPCVEWWRGNAWGVTVPKLPLVDGGATGPGQFRVLTYFHNRYGSAFEDPIFTAHLERGYTHYSTSPPDAFASGMSVNDYVRQAVRIVQAGFYHHVLLRSKYWPDWARDRRLCDELIDKLLSAGAMQVHTPSWEMNWASPDECRQWIDEDAARIGGRCRTMLHFYPHYISWQLNTESSTSFWERNVGKASGVLYQADPNWSMGMQQARTVDALQRLIAGGVWGLSHTFDVTAWEPGTPTLQYWNVADEDRGDLVGYETLCTPGPMTVKGFGAGARYPSGMPI